MGSGRSLVVSRKVERNHRDVAFIQASPRLITEFGGFVGLSDDMALKKMPHVLYMGYHTVHCDKFL